MKRFWLLAASLTMISPIARAEGSGDSSPAMGRYQMFSNPHANRVYLLDTQTGRVFQLANYKDVGKEIFEEVPFVYGTTRLCSPAEYDRSPEKCFNRNFEYVKNLMDLRREQNNAVPPPAPAKPDVKP